MKCEKCDRCQEEQDDAVCYCGSLMSSHTPSSSSGCFLAKEMPCPGPNKPIGNKVAYQVAVFYPGGWEAYGGIHTFETESEAREKRQEIMTTGFKDVHIWSVTTEMIQE